MPRKTKPALYPGTPQPSPWRNRIVGFGEARPDQLQPNPRNPRFHTRRQEEALVDVLSGVGIVQDVIVNTTTGYLVDGHLRVQAALSAGVPLLPVTYVELDEDEELLVLTTFDPLAQLAVWDKERLADALPDARKHVIPGSVLDGFLESLSLKAAPVMTDEERAFLGQPVSDPPIESFDADGAPAPSEIREMVVIYLREGERDRFYEQATALATARGLDSMADAVMAVLAEAYEAIVPAPLDTVS